MRTIVYVDALNLYYGALKGTGYKWLDLQKLFAKIWTNRTCLLNTALQALSISRHKYLAHPTTPQNHCDKDLIFERYGTSRPI